MADNGQTIIDLDKKRMNAMSQKDIATLNALLSDDLVYTHSSECRNVLHAHEGSICAAQDRVENRVEPDQCQAVLTIL